jgi:hypothetical protein
LSFASLAHLPGGDISEAAVTVTVNILVASPKRVRKSGWTVEHACTSIIIIVYCQMRQFEDGGRGMRYEVRTSRRTRRFENRELGTRYELYNKDLLSRSQDCVTLKDYR